VALNDALGMAQKEALETVQVAEVEETPIEGATVTVEADEIL